MSSNIKTHHKTIQHLFFAHLCTPQASLHCLIKYGYKSTNKKNCSMSDQDQNWEKY